MAMTEEANVCVEIFRKAARFGVADCQYCPAYNVCPTGTVGWNNECMFDTAADLIESLSAQLDQVTRERDAAVKREWDLFDLLSSAWHGKAYYFKQEDGSVYSRESCEYLTFDQAIDEFAQSLTVAGDINVPTYPKWISVEDEPKQTSDYLVYVWVAYPDGIAQMEMRKAIYNIVHKEWYVDCGRLEVVGKPTHWMPLPSPPKEDE